jgi:hypothetical protein
VWLVIRGAFWVLTITSSEPWGDFVFYSLYWLPYTLQFGSFMMLPLFFAHILYPANWKKYWVYFGPIYFFFLVSLILFQIVWSLLAALETVRNIL